MTEQRRKTDTMTGSYGEELLRAALAGTDPDASPVTHTEVIPPAQARFADWPQWLDPAIVAAAELQPVGRMLRSGQSMGGGSQRALRGIGERLI